MGETLTACFPPIATVATRNVWDVSTMLKCLTPSRHMAWMNFPELVSRESLTGEGYV